MYTMTYHMNRNQNSDNIRDSYVEYFIGLGVEGKDVQHIYVPELDIYTYTQYISHMVSLHFQSHNAQSQQHQRHHAYSGRGHGCFT